MSYDRKIDFVCPHTIVEEALFVSELDRRTVRPLRPVASGASLRVRINGIAELPSAGLASTAEAKVSRRGPFNIAVGVNDQLIVRVDSRAAQTVTVKAGQKITARELAADLASKISGVAVTVGARGRIRFQTRSKGKVATLFFESAGSTLAATIGLPVDRQFRGKVLSPGWSLVRDPNAIVNGARLVVLDKPLKGFQDYVELDYATVRTECRRCGGLGIENDWRYNVNGDVIELRNEALLIQEIQKIVYTLQGSNPFHNWYGTGIINSVGKKIANGGLLQSFIVGDVRDAFRRWQSVKRQQEQDVGQFVSDEEYPFQILEVSLEPDQSDPTIVFVNTVIQNRSQQRLEITRGVRVPIPEDLLGSTAQEGVIRQSLEGFTGIDSV